MNSKSSQQAVIRTPAFVSRMSSPKLVAEYRSTLRHGTAAKLIGHPLAPIWEKYLTHLLAELKVRGIAVINPETGEPHEERSRHE